MWILITQLIAILGMISLILSPDKNTNIYVAEICFTASIVALGCKPESVLDKVFRISLYLCFILIIMIYFYNDNGINGDIYSTIVIIIIILTMAFKIKESFDINPNKKEKRK